MPLRDADPGHSNLSECPGFFYLTPREVEILELTAAGETAGSIALKLVISPTTVKAHLANVREKAKARNTTHAVVLAITWGFLSLDAFLRPRPHEQMG